ncbi:MAG: hypothetical protein M1819_007090 [Sarea resinae]|nr:MAG: hypothetical protein M1819_007090 [Sarea resinae]
MTDPEQSGSGPPEPTTPAEEGDQTEGIILEPEGILQESDACSTSDKSIKSTKSLTDSLFEVVLENGRQYCNDTYFMPNDDAELTRLNIIHQVNLLVLDGDLTKVPIVDSMRRCLDVGTGAGDWAIEFAEQYPDIEVVGTDLSPFQPEEVPSNLYFEVDDATEEWTFSEPFDFIHMRHLAGSFSDWMTIYKEAYKNLRPGGYLEIAEFEHMQMSREYPDSYVNIWVTAKQSAAELAGTPRTVAHLKRSMLEAAGFCDIETTVIDVPLGTWPEDARKLAIGKLWLISTLEGLEAASMRLLTNQLGWGPGQVKEICEKVRTELIMGFGQVYTPFYFVTARKPIDSPRV